MSQETKRFEFGEFVLDADEKMLLRHGKSMPIPPKVLELLFVLVENHGHVLEKEVLMTKLWANTFVEEGNLTFTIRKLRTILDDDTRNPRFIETIPKRGYRFIAEVSSNTGQLLPEARIAGENRKGLEDRGSGKASRFAKNSYLASFGILAVLIAGLIAVIWWLTINRIQNFSSLSIERLTSNGKAKFAAISPDGKFAGYIVDDEGKQSIRLKNVATGSDVQILAPLTGTQLHSIAFSPGGDHLYYAEKEALFRLPILGGPPEQVLANFVSGSQFSPITFSLDRKQFAFVRRDSESSSSVILVNVDGSGERVLAKSDAPAMFLRSAVWSPDGKVIALLTSGGKRISLVRVADGVVSAFNTPPWKVVSQIAWKPDGSGLLAVATEDPSFTSQIWQLSYPDGNAENITNDLNNYQSISITADGRTLAAVRVEQVAHIWAGSTEEGGLFRQITHGVDGYDGIYGLDYLSNGEIIYEAVPGGKGQILSINAEGGEPKLIVNDSGSASASPDGKYAIYQTTDESKALGLFKLEISSGQRVRLTTGKDVWIAYSADSKWVVFTRWGEQADLWKISIDGGDPVKLTNLAGYAQAPSVSPDGKLIAFHLWKPNKEPSVFAIIPFNGGDVIKTFQLSLWNSRVQHAKGYGKDTVQWTPDGQAIDYAVFNDNASNIWRQPIDDSPPFQVTNFTDQQIFNFAYSPDGKKLALSRGTYGRDVVLLKLGER